MAAKVTLDSAGRILIPKALRERWHLEPGDILVVKATAEEIKLRLVSDKAVLTKERGVWVFRTGDPLPARVAGEVLETVRAERNHAIPGDE